jgi:hypothetical protein
VFDAPILIVERSAGAYVVASVSGGIIPSNQWLGGSRRTLVMTLRNAIGLVLLTAGAVGLVASGGKPLTLNSGSLTIPTGPDSFASNFFLTIPAGTLLVPIAIGSVLFIWPRGPKGAA